MGRNFAYKEPLEAGVVAPLGPLGGKANTQLFAGDRENQWVSSAKAAMGRFPHWVILLSLKWCIKGGGGENKSSVWRQWARACATSPSVLERVTGAENGPSGESAPRNGCRAPGTQFWAGVGVANGGWKSRVGLPNIVPFYLGCV